MRVDVDDLIDLAGIVRRFKELGNKNVTKSAVTNWRARDPEFAECEIEWDGTYPLFRWSKVLRWGRKTGRLDKSAA